MDFIQHTINWCKGEILEARLILLFGIVVIICGFLFWKLGTTPNAKAMLFPLLVVGILSSATGINMNFSNKKRIVEYTAAYEKDAQALVKAEKERTETFIKWYPITRYIFTGFAIIGIALFLFWSVPIGRAIGISLILMTLSVFVIDHFSEERAEVYHQKIEEALN